jgi:hypothetical protein
MDFNENKEKIKENNKINMFIIEKKKPYLIITNIYYGE